MLSQMKSIVLPSSHETLDTDEGSIIDFICGNITVDKVETSFIGRREYQHLDANVILNATLLIIK
jgi:hypothetical protein